MKRTEYFLMDEFISQAELDSCRQYLKKEEIEELYFKCMLFLSTINLPNFESIAFAEKMFSMGYLAAHMNFPKKNGE
jgi:hypothetical protein